MAATQTTDDFRRLADRLDEIRATLGTLELDGWLLYDLHHRNPVAARLLGQGDLSRRYFVWIPADGDPEVVMHGIEEAPWAGWPWRRRRYVGWKELSDVLETVVGGRRVAMEVSENDAVPALDRVPAGVVDLVRAAGAEVASSGELITRFHSRWSREDLASHRRASTILAEVAREALGHLARAVDAGETVTEGRMHAWLLDRLAERDCGVGPDCIFAIGRNAADPHYRSEGSDEAFRRGDVVLLDLWSKEAEDAIYADQTWMAVLDDRMPESLPPLWAAVRDARDAAVDLVRDRWADGRPVQGYEVDDVARGVIADRGHGDDFIHRTGHSIDQSTHGMGPNIDNLETHEVRRLVPGIGFSIEPGIYRRGDVGLRSELNVYIGEDGPEVTTPDPQTEPFLLFDT